MNDTDEEYEVHLYQMTTGKLRYQMTTVYKPDMPDNFISYYVERKIELSHTVHCKERRTLGAKTQSL